MKKWFLRSIQKSSVKTSPKSLDYLVKQQLNDGGWGQGGGWRQGGPNGGRIEGTQTNDKSDVGNTCIAMLALIRAGNTPTQGTYAKELKRGLDFLFTNVEKADDTSMYVTEARGTLTPIKNWSLCRYISHRTGYVRVKK